MDSKEPPYTTHMIIRLSCSLARHVPRPFNCSVDGFDNYLREHFGVSFKHMPRAFEDVGIDYRVVDHRKFQIAVVRHGLTILDQMHA